MNMVASSPSVEGNVEVDGRSEYAHEVDGLVDAMIDGRIRDVNHLQELLPPIAKHYWKTVGTVKEDLRRRTSKRLGKAHLSSEQLRVIAPELKEFMGISDQQL
jgi:hypothetical protein